VVIPSSLLITTQRNHFYFLFVLAPARRSGRGRCKTSLGPWSSGLLLEATGSLQSRWETRGRYPKSFSPSCEGPTHILGNEVVQTDVEGLLEAVLQGADVVNVGQVLVGHGCCFGLRFGLRCSLRHSAELPNTISPPLLALGSHLPLHLVQATPLPKSLGARQRNQLRIHTK